ncbi:MAG: hypothetical protein DYG94_06955 [Leptolyngbya sp. PLA3]|nr:MAG: hypothetical protein EDM82_06300 [Cyanobacteria bacterium CYA]MCE7968467.1 hypothetical protein [Leptolyngbya sp. PL-A3]
MRTTGRRATACSTMGNGTWTAEMIPAKITPPAVRVRQPAGGRVRFGPGKMTSMGNCADLVVAFNGQVPNERLLKDASGGGTVILLENKEAADPGEQIRDMYNSAVEGFGSRGLIVHEPVVHEACLEFVHDPSRRCWARLQRRRTGAGIRRRV